jgi:chromosome partitioning protein
MLFDQFLTDHIDPRDEYSVILIDLPGLTNNVTYNGLWAAGNVIAPVEMGTFESEQAAALRDDIKLFGDRFDRDLQLVMVLPNKLDTRTKLDKAYLETFTEEYPDAIAEPVPRSQDIRNAAEAGRTLFASEESSKTAQRAREAYQVNGEELLRRIGATVPTGGEVDG